MSLAKITQVKALALAVPGDDIDTDRIIPARFLRCVTFDGLGEHAFRDERTGPDGKERAHPMNSAQAARIAAAKQGVMVVGFNLVAAAPVSTPPSRSGASASPPSSGAVSPRSSSATPPPSACLA